MRTGSLVAAVVAGLLLAAPQAVAESRAVAAQSCPSPLRVVPPPRLDAPLADDLSCADMRGMTLYQEELAGEDLRGTDLTEARLPQTDLSDANLTGANLTRAALPQADLTGATLRGARLTGVSLDQAHLANADLRDADLSGADLDRADLRGADLRGADLSGADLSRTELAGADLRGATLAGTGASDASGLGEVLVDPIGPGAYVQLGHLLLAPAVAIALPWWRGRIGYLVRHRRTTRVRLVDVAAIGVGVAFAVAGLYAVCCGVVRVIATTLTGWLWAADPGPLGAVGLARPVPQLVLGAVLLVLAAIVLRLPGRRVPVAQPPAPTAALAVGKPTPGPASPVFGPVARGLATIAGLLGVADLLSVLFLWPIGALADGFGPWRADTALGHLVVVAAATVLLFRVAQPPQRNRQLTTLSGFVLDADGRAPYVWLSGGSTGRRPANHALPWETLTQVHLIRTIGAPAAEPGTATVAVHLPGADKPTEFARQLPVSPAQASRLRAMLPGEKVTEVVRTPGD